MIYIASPYTSDYPMIRNARFISAKNYTMFCMNKGETVFSPIVYGHAFMDLAEDEKTFMQFTSWVDFNEHMLIHSDEMRILTLQGWEESAGIAYEKELCLAHGIPIKLVDYKYSFLRDI